MCGRFALGLARNQIQRVHGHPDINVDEWLDEDHFVPRYNVAPHSRAPVLRRRQGGRSSGAAAGDAGTGLVLQTMRWGLVPHWSKHEDKTLNTINARSENLVHGGGMWGSIKGKKRCVVLAQGYYEWQKKGKDRIPFFIKHKDDKLMLLAGLYDCTVLEGEKDPLWTFSIVTTMANKDFEWLHERQPVILTSQRDVGTWLDTSPQTWTDELTTLVEPYHDASSLLECYQVPKEVGRVGTESKTFIEPIANRKDGIQAMFSRMADASPQKRKRVPSPPEADTIEGSSRTIEEGVSLPKRPRQDFDETEETVGGNKSQEIVEIPSPEKHTPSVPQEVRTPTKPKVSKPDPRSPAKATPTKKSPKKAKASPKNKITAFFSKTG